MPPLGDWSWDMKTVWQCSLSCILVAVFLLLLYSHAAMSTDDGRSQIREINLSAMDVCWTNKLFLMRQFGLSQSNFAMKKVAKCNICSIFFCRIRLNISFLKMFIVYTKYFEIDIIFYLNKKFAWHEKWFNIRFCGHLIWDICWRD